MIPNQVSDSLKRQNALLDPSHSYIGDKKPGIKT